MALKGRHLPKRKRNKSKRWRRGQSSSSNPETKRFRTAAENSFFNQQSDLSSLTVSAVAKHNDTQTDLAKSGDLDVQSIGGNTFTTVASNWIDCKNATFSSVHHFLNSNLALHKEMLAILAAVTEVIKLHGGSESATAYFAALMTALNSAENENSLAAMAFLLSLVIKKVPIPVLRSRFSECAKKILELLAKYTDGASAFLIKSLLQCLTALLKAQEEAVWSTSSTHQIYLGLLTFITHSKPKVRKTAHINVKMILKDSLMMTQENHPDHHICAAQTAKYCVHQIEEFGGGPDAINTLHVLHFLKDVIASFPRHSVKSVCEVILKVMTLGSSFVFSCGMQVLHSLFCSQPSTMTLPAELNAQMISALYDYQPSENDAERMKMWLEVMEKALSNLGRLDKHLAVGHLPHLFSVGMACFLSDRKIVQQSAMVIMKNLLTECVMPAADSLLTMVNSVPDITTTPVYKILKILKSGFSYQFHATWGYVLQVFSVLIKALGKHFPDLIKPCLTSLSDLRGSQQSPSKANLDYVVGCAIKTMGPKRVLEAIPLNITGEGDDLNFARSWLLPLLQTNIMDTELGFFVAYFLPLASKLKQNAFEFQKIRNSVVARSYEALRLQIWSLLPAFCTRPTDLIVSFRSIAKVMGSVISDEPDLRIKTMLALKKLINLNLDNDKNKAELGLFAKNFLPILFNVFCTEDVGEKASTRQATLEMIRVYLQVSDQNLIWTFQDNCMQKMAEENISTFRKHALLDISLALFPYLDMERLKKLFELAQTNLKCLDRAVQKKSYRIIEEICSGKSAYAQDFVKVQLHIIRKMLLASLSTSSPASKAPRLRCLTHIFHHLQNCDSKFVHSVLPEAILCTKELGEKARQAAYTLLVEIGRALLKWNNTSEEAAIEEYFKLLSAGLAGSPQMICATIQALARVMYEFKDLVSSTLLDALVQNICQLLTNRAREIVKSAVGFLKVLLTAFSEQQLVCYLQKIISTLNNLKENSQHHLRFKTKFLFTKLIRKFGYDHIFKLSSVSMRKVLANIQKTERRNKQKRKEVEKSENAEFVSPPERVEDFLRDTDSESEEDEEKGKRRQKRSKSSNAKAWLQEGAEDEIVDFMDPSVSKKVLATKPRDEKESRHNKVGSFKKASDGRLIIMDEREVDDEMGVDNDDDSDSNVQFGRKQGKKRKLEAGLDLDSDDMVPNKYKAGGSGIHRPIRKVVHKDKMKDEGGIFVYKAKKAGGDVKIKGKPDPFAYLKLNLTSLNKRKKAKVQGKFRNLMKAAKKGASKKKRPKRKK